MSFYTSVEKLGKYILCVSYDERGERHLSRTVYRPSVFRKTDQETGFTSMFGDHMERIQFPDMRACSDFLERNEAENFRYWGNTDFVSAFISDYFPSPREFEMSHVNVLTFDIEVQSDRGFETPQKAGLPVLSISCKSSKEDIYRCWSTGEYDVSSQKVAENERLMIDYVRCEDERAVIRGFLDYVSTHHPDILTGWNSNGYDVPYLVNRIINLFGDEETKKLSPWDLKPKLKETQYEYTYVIPGVSCIDYMELYKKFGVGNLQSYRLDFVANHELKERKLDYSEFDTLQQLYKIDFQKFIDYNIRDVYLVNRLDDKLALLNLLMTISFKAGINFSKAFGTVYVWDSYVFNVLREKKVVVPPKYDPESYSPIQGGHVKSPKPGMYDWVVSFDLNALYPHIIMQYNMSPETIVKEANLIVEGTTPDVILEKESFERVEGLCYTATGQPFSIEERGIFAQIMEDLYEERKATKAAMLQAKREKEEADKSNKALIFELDKRISRNHATQNAVKVLMNGFYGAMCNEYFRYYDPAMGEAITVTGQLTVRWAEKKLNEFLNRKLKTDNVDYVIAIDTDSCYVRMDGVVKAMGFTDRDKICSTLDKFCDTVIEPLFESAFEQLAKILNAYAQKMSMKREIIADKAVWTAKKRYVANVLNSEGVQYSKPEIKMVGIEAVRSSTPETCKKMIEDAIRVILNEGESSVQAFVEKCRAEFRELPPEEVAVPASVSAVKKYMDGQGCKKGTPINSRAAITHNSMVKRLGLENKYQLIRNGDKIKYVLLREPNPAGSHVLGFVNVFPKEFKCEAYVDYDRLFEKSFVKPIELILNAIGWRQQKVATLDMFFS